MGADAGGDADTALRSDLRNSSTSLFQPSKHVGKHSGGSRSVGMSLAWGGSRGIGGGSTTTGGCNGGGGVEAQPCARSASIASESRNTIELSLAIMCNLIGIGLPLDAFGEGCRRGVRGNQGALGADGLGIELELSDHDTQLLLLVV